ncbi:SRPBCC family protein [Massilia sp. TS11]|uniref:SRPBCC family protein n=1 Tax=Massilia sp. TS11 TaxID=2908003 RepID=UPI001EDBC015|nr:SRPBCC family protein [Massilia sp. TS11]MCG2585090.1 DUF1857 family protein [Massilia sp. TS11]
MKFEHLIEINDPLNPLMDTITREQLWRGLVLRADQPTLFMPHLDRCEIGARAEGSFGRRLHFGELVIEDTVYLRPLEEVRYEVPAQGEIPASHMTMAIEMPAAGRLFVRFRYDDGQAAAADGATAMYEDFKRSAYQEADIDTIRILRELAAAGKLDGDTLN